MNNKGEITITKIALVIIFIVMATVLFLFFFDEVEISSNQKPSQLRNDSNTVINLSRPNINDQIKDIKKDSEGLRNKTVELDEAQTTGTYECLQFDASNNNINEQNRINLVLVGFNYRSLEDFRKVISLSMDAQNGGLFSVEPFKSNRDKFNIFFVNKIEKRSFENIPQEIRADEYIGPARELSAICKYANKIPITFVNDYFLSKAYPKEHATIAIEYPAENIDLNLILHEVGGHAIGGLYDEYQWQNWLPEPETMEPNAWAKQCFYVSPNELSCKYEYGGYSCSNPQREIIDRCNNEAPWHDLVGNGCGKDGIIDCEGDNNMEIKCRFRGCSPNSFVAVRNIMGHGGISNQYGQNNERLMCRNIKELAGSVGGICNSLCLDGCEQGKKCISGNCISI